MKLISTILSTFFAAIVVVILALIVFTPKCQHEERRLEYVLHSPDNVGNTGYIKKYCKECDYYLGNTYLHGKPTDSSYLDLIREHSDGDELVDGEYYTMTATVTLAYYYGSTISISCKVGNEDIVVYFSVRFREEYADKVSYSVLEQGDEITFRGKFDEMTCDWTDCELIEVQHEKNP